MHWTYAPAMEQGVFLHEGGYTNDPRDPGGPTNWGITIYDARRYWKSNATAADVKAMPKSVAEAIYWPHYAVPLCYDDLPAGPDYAALDYGINSGVSRAAKVDAAPGRPEQCRRHHRTGHACRHRSAQSGGAGQCDLRRAHGVPALAQDLPGIRQGLDAACERGPGIGAAFRGSGKTHGAAGHTDAN